MDNKKALDEARLVNVTGGANKEAEKEQLMRISCPYCKEVFKANVQKSVFKCPACEKTFEIKG